MLCERCVCDMTILLIILIATLLLVCIALGRAWYNATMKARLYLVTAQQSLYIERYKVNDPLERRVNLCAFLSCAELPHTDEYFKTINNLSYLLDDAIRDAHENWIALQHLNREAALAERRSVDESIKEVTKS